MFGSMDGAGQYGDKLAEVLLVAHRDFLAWKKVNGYQCSQPKFTPARLSRKIATSYLEVV